MSNAVLALKLFWEFFKIGLFAVGGGPATLPFLMELSQRVDWFTMADLTDMIAVSESTPGPLGLNMATYVGVNTLGVWGGVISTLGLVTPSIIVICIIAAFFARANSNRFVQAAFGAIRPSVVAIIAVAVFGICKVTLFPVNDGIFTPMWKSITLGAAVLLALQFKVMKKIHPFFWFVFGAIVGIIFKF